MFTTPTLNGYKRFRPYSLAPDRAVWGHDNRGVMVRVLGGAGRSRDAHLENRVGEPAANPYLYMASQILAGLDGLERQLDPGPSADTPYETKAELLPRSLGEALAALRGDTSSASGFGDFFVDYLLTIKDAEIDRFKAEVSDWEHREILRDVLNPDVTSQRCAPSYLAETASSACRALVSSVERLALQAFPRTDWAPAVSAVVWNVFLLFVAMALLQEEHHSSLLEIGRPIKIREGRSSIAPSARL